MKLTVVVDNTAPIIAKKPFLAEHGFSLLIDYDDKKILFDAGQSGAVIQNLSLLGVHPGHLDMLVLSHGHYDHAGGLYHVLKHADKKLPVYGHSDIFAQRFSLAGSRRFIGIPYSKEQLSAAGADWRLGQISVEIAPNLWFSGEIARQTDYERGDSKLVICRDSCDCQDPFNDDAALYYRKPDGLVVIAGCAHSGLVNTVKHGLALTGSTKLLGWVGGTHLGPVSKEQQVKTIDTLERFQPKFIMTSHCTGFPMMAELRHRFGDRFIPAFVCTTIEC